MGLRDLQPLPLQDIRSFPHSIQEWFRKLQNYFKQGAVPWSFLDFDGSNLTDIQTRNHNDLQTIQGSGNYHLSSGAATKAEAFDESAQDAVGAMVDGTGNVPLTYTDATPKLSAALAGTATAAAAAVSTHEIEMKVNGTTYYFLVRDTP